MLPIFRTISVGGVFLAMTVLALALSPPGASHLRLTSERPAARGALQVQTDHPEWRQFLIQAAIQRANELNRLRDLSYAPVNLPGNPDAARDYVAVRPPVESSKTPVKSSIRTVGLPATRSDADPDDETGSIDMAPRGAIPIEIGEPSSTELPINPAEAKPPVIRAPLSVSPEPAEPVAATLSADDKPMPGKSPIETRTIIAKPHRARTADPTRAQAPTQAQIGTQMPPPFNLLQALFESLWSKPAEQAATAPKPRVKVIKRTVAIRAAAQ